MPSEFIKVAQAVRVESDSRNDRVLVVFEVTHPLFKKQVKDAWAKNCKCFLVMEKSE